MRKILIIFAGLLLMAGSGDIHAKSFYNSVRNQFGGLYPHPGMRMQGRYKAIDGDLLVEENASMAAAVTLDTMAVAASEYRYQMRLANLNNKQGKTVSVKNAMTGEKTRLTGTEWGLVFNADGQGNYCALMLSCDNSAPYDDITDHRSMVVTLVERQGGKVNELAQATLAHGVSLEDGLNTVCIDVDERGVHVSMGKDELQPVLEASVQRPAGSVRVGYVVGPGARVAIERAVLTINNEKQTIPPTLWTIEALDQHFEESLDPNEGYWKYLDRDMEDTWLKLGGRYTLALVRANDGYDLIYIDGAQVKKSQWLPGMRKGHIARTAFVGNYDLDWTDATMEPLPHDDSYATIDNGVILTLHFPAYNSQVRLAKKVDIDD